MLPRRLPGLTRDAQALDLRQFVVFCELRRLGLFEVCRSDIETFEWELEAEGRVTATIARRLCTVTGFYRYAEEEGLIAHSRLSMSAGPRIDDEAYAIDWTATRSARFSLPPGSARPASTR